MNFKIKYIAAVVFCVAFLIQGVSAQNSGMPPKTDKSTEKKNPIKTKPGDTISTDTAVELDFPEVEGWEKDATYKYPTAALGYSVNYESRDGGRVTFYVYHGDNNNIPDGADSKILKDEMEKVKGEIYYIGKMGTYKDIKELSNDTVTLGGSSGKIKSLYSLFNLKIQGETAVSEIYLFGYGGNFIKIRATRAKDSNVAGNKAVAKLLEEIDKMFAK